MKKAARVLALLLSLALCLSLAPACFAEDNYDTLADWDLKVKVPEGKTAVLKGSSYYIYGQRAGEIPYVMIMAYRYESEEKFIEDFTASMSRSYSDLTVTDGAAPVTISGKDGWEIDYAYKVSGYDVRDRRIVMKVGEWVYMFASKEIDELGRTIGTMLEDVVADCEFLSETGSELPGLEDEDELSVAYVYYQKDGMPKYWLDFSGAMSDAIVLHCLFRSGEPSFYEQVFYLDLETAEISGGRITVNTVYNRYGEDVSAWFRTLSIRFSGNAAELTVKRDEKTLAGGAEDNILTGRYRMVPAGAGLSYEYYRDDGLRKYWLDLGGEDIYLHAMFRSGESEYHEEVFTLELDSAEEPDEYSVSIREVYSETGLDVSEWFQSLTLTAVEGAVMMNVRREEKTLAGGADDNILTGVYLFEPHTYLLPAHKGPYTEQELGKWAQSYYLRRSGFYPPQAEVEKNADGTFTVQLFETVKLDGVSHTATSAWYIVDAYGSGTDGVTGRAVSLCG